MEILACGHAALAAPVRVCPHWSALRDVDYARCLRGVGIEFDAACLGCGARFEKGEIVEWVTVCGACHAQFEDAVDEFSWLGKAQIIEAPREFDATLRERDLPFGNAVFGLAGDGRVFALLNNELSEIGTETRVVARLELPPEIGDYWRNPQTPRLIVSKSGRFVALVNDYRSLGAIVDTKTGAVTLNLDRGDYCSDTTPFPLAFFESEGRELVVHGRDWNRLDISDPQTGELLSVRESPTCEADSTPEHDLDYFHGRLHVSPNCEWILDDGWVWHPVGVPAWWNLFSWLKENVWESEDGESRVDSVWRTYYWNKAMCWIGDSHVAIDGIGIDDEKMQIGARIFDLKGEEIQVFAGPDGQFFSDGTRLFSVSEGGFGLWDVQIGARTGRIDGFLPQFQIDGALVEIKSEKLRIWYYGVPE